MRYLPWVLVALVLFLGWSWHSCGLTPRSHAGLGFEVKAPVTDAAVPPTIGAHPSVLGSVLVPVAAPCPAHVPISITTLQGHIPLIVRVGAKKQMRGINAAGVVATMADVHAIGYWAIYEFPRGTMGTPLSDTLHVVLAVAHVRERASPQPTFIGATDVNAIPERFGGRSHA